MHGSYQRIPIKFTENWLEGLDGRTGVARDLKERYKELTDDLGGFKNLSYQQRALCSRALFIEYNLKKQEEDMALGKDFDPGVYAQSVNTLIGLFRMLGIERKKQEAITLNDFIESKSKGA
ncbi:hypothetical protein [Thiomicrospira cyclica]|uniref:Uncharacterized protein n=1 Tax=Thiomicrospira cyclica (strain DSM 14477 / JCM 11371 / ALM1) TaxID=717773 RepID=F6DCF9_THICA|nr:hypothetical protein [Thiomicrospira cyclica]AEG31545.1 hypothetical protein Thicy_0773 [Thiomicrospira cyclica ALM1]